MISVPGRLIGSEAVQVLMQGPHSLVLKKSLQEPVRERSSYLSMHAASLVIRGEQVVKTAEGASLRIREGEMGFLGRGLYTLTDLLGQGGGYESLVLFWDDHLLPEASTRRPNAPSFLGLPRTDLEELFMQQVSDLAGGLSRPESPLADLKIREFFALLGQRPEGAELLQDLAGFARPEVRNLRQFLESHFDKPLRIEDYAWLTGKSLSTFRREFRQRFGTTPRKWLIQKRMGRAHELLEAGTHSVSELAGAVGYENVSHFIREFRKEFGFTPGQRVGG